jgi:ATP-dependent exoDNAse (exonuclease V) alpha subunit
VVREVNARENTLRVDLSGGRQAEYDPRRLRGVAVYEKAERSFATGDRVQLTAPDPSAGLANRELGKIERIGASGEMTIRTDSGRTATLAGDQKHVDHGYAVTSHSAQGATADRVIVHAESSQSAALVNQRFAYVAGSRMREGLDVYTDNAGRLESALDRRFDKSAAVTDRALGRTAAPVRRSFSEGGGQDAPAARQPSQGQQRVEHGGTSQEIAHGR